MHTFTIQLAFALLLSATSAQSKALVAAADPWPPYVDFSQVGGGFSIEIIRAALQAKGHQLIVKNVPWARAVKGVEQGVYDLLPNAWYTKERQLKFRYSKPFAMNTMRLVVNKKNTFIYKNESSLNNLRVGLINGASYGEKLKHAKPYEIIYTASMLTNIKMLINNRIDLTIEDELGLIRTLKTSDSRLLDKISLIDPPFSSNPLHIAVSHGHENAIGIIQDFDDGLTLIKENGIYDAILKRYGLIQFKH